MRFWWPGSRTPILLMSLWVGRERKELGAGAGMGLGWIGLSGQLWQEDGVKEEREMGLGTQGLVE